MHEVTDEVIAPEVVLRRAEGTDLAVAPGGDGARPTVAVGQGALWVRAESTSDGIEIGHGALTAVLRHGTVLFDAHAGSGLVIVLRGEVDLVPVSGDAVSVSAGDAVAFDAQGAISAPDPVNGAELAQDPFVRLNLVHDAVAGVAWSAPAPPPGPTGTGDAATPEDPTETGRSRVRSRFGGRRS